MRFTKREIEAIAGGIAALAQCERTFRNAIQDTKDLALAEKLATTATNCNADQQKLREMIGAVPC